MDRLLIIQYGDYKEALERIRSGGLENYREQKKSVDFVSELSKSYRVTTLALVNHEYSASFSENLFADGVNLKSLNKKHIMSLLDKYDPDYVILRTPHLDFLREIVKRNIYLLPWFADIFGYSSLYSRFMNYNFSRILNNSKIKCVANHSLNASRSLVDCLGVNASKVIPWERVKLNVVLEHKKSVFDRDSPRAFYAGMIREDKGIGDCLNAICLLKKKNVLMQMTFAGAGNIVFWKEKARELDIMNQVHFTGLIPNDQIKLEMQSHDFVIVPTHHTYNEGMPNTIPEGLASRSVLILSDHPAFQGRLVSREHCLMFHAGDADALSNCIIELLNDSLLYEKLSFNSSEAHDSLYIGMEWTSMILEFLNDPLNKTGWVELNSLKRLEVATVPSF